MTRGGTGNRLVPPLIHRIWLDDPMPDPFAGYGQQWQELHPGWEVLDWRTSALLPELTNRDLFDRAQEFYPQDWKRFQADLLRLELLWRYGGLYVDTDAEPRRNIEPLLSDRFVAGRSPQQWRGRHPITNAVMASVPEHPVPHDAERFRGKPLARSVGPWLITRTFDTRIWSDASVLDGLYDGEWLVHHWNSAKRRRGVGV